MDISMYDMSVTVFVDMLVAMRDWFDKLEARAAESALIDARLAPDMHPLPFQVQIATDSAIGFAAQMTGTRPPIFSTPNSSFAELKDRCDRSVAYLRSIDCDQLEAGLAREVVLSYPNGTGARFPNGLYYFTILVLPNFFFHFSMAYAILRAHGIPVGKMDYIPHLAPYLMDT